MCRDKKHGGRRCASQELNTARRQIQRVTALRADPNISEERDAILLARWNKAMDRLGAIMIEEMESSEDETPDYTAEVALDSIARKVASYVPERLIITGEELNSRHSFTSVLEFEYDESKFNPIANREGAHRLGYWESEPGSTDDGPMHKPVGGLWIAPLSEYNEKSVWANNEASDMYSDPVTHNVSFKPDAQVVIIDSWEDYKELVDAHSRPARYIDWSTNRPEEKFRKGIDYPSLNADAIYVTDNAVYQTVRNLRDYPRYERDYESLYGWDISSGVIMNPDSITVTKSTT